MGFFDFLKTKQVVEIKFSELEPWLNRQVESKRLDQKIAKSKEAVKQLIEETKAGLDELQKATLMNDKIPIKEKQIMEGHRKAYAMRIKRFLDEINVPGDFSEIGHYNARFSETLTSLSEDTQKNYIILKHFMELELGKIVKSIKSIEGELSKLQADIDSAGVELIKEAKIKLKQYNDDITKKEKLESEKQEQEKELELLRNKKDKVETRLNELKASREYEDFRIFIEDKKSCEDSIGQIEQELITAFAELNRPLKKFTHNSIHEKLVDKYIADPTGALEEDASLVIDEVLRKMHQELETLELKEKQLENTENVLTKMTRDKLLEKKMELSRLKSLSKESSSKITRSVVALNISENESWLKSVNSKISHTEKNIEKMIKESEEINLEYSKQKVIEKIKEVSPVVKVVD